MQPANTVTTKINWRIIDWMRGLAALGVVFNHSRGFLFSDATAYATNILPKEQWGWWEWLNVILLQHSNLGPEFVILFFVLSGFSIAHSLHNGNDPLPFYKRRLVRLYPPYLLGILWALLAFLLIRYYAPDVFYNTTEGQPALVYDYQNFVNIKSFIANLLYVPDNNYLTPQYWSLPYEVIFYFIAPWIIRKTKWYGIASVAGFALGWVLYKHVYLENLNGRMLTQFALDYNIYFLVGILFYKYRDLLLRTFRPGIAVSIILLLVIFECMVIAKSYLFAEEANKFTGLTMVLFSYILLFAGLRHELRFKLMEWIGAFSYTLYVSHVATIFILKIILHRVGYNYYFIHSLYTWYLGIAVSVMIAWVLYYIAEYPSIQYLKKLRSKTKAA